MPYTEEEFKIDFTRKDMETKMEPPPYVHIRRSILYALSVIIDQSHGLYLNHMMPWKCAEENNSVIYLHDKHLAHQNFLLFWLTIFHNIH